MMDALLAKIDDLCSEVDTSTKFLNCGGCCVFAAAMGKKLQALGEVRIRVLHGPYGDRVNINKLKNNIRDHNSLDEWNDNGLIFYHVIVEFTYKRRKYHIDSTGVHKSFRGKSELAKGNILPGWFSVEQADSFAQSSNWNHMFDRGQIPDIHNRIEKYNLN